MNQKPTPKTGLTRISAAFFYSLNGLRAAIANEAAVRQELGTIAIVSVVLFFLPLPIVYKGLLFSATLAILVVELLNTAIESVVDIASPEYKRLAKQAKDIGSSAVFVSIILAAILWIGAVVMIIRGSVY